MFFPGSSTPQLSFPPSTYILISSACCQSDLTSSCYLCLHCSSKESPDLSYSNLHIVLHIPSSVPHVPPLSKFWNLSIVPYIFNLYSDHSLQLLILIETWFSLEAIFLWLTAFKWWKLSFPTLHITESASEGCALTPHWWFQISLLLSSLKYLYFEYHVKTLCVNWTKRRDAQIPNVGIIQSTKGLKRTKRGRENLFLLVHVCALSLSLHPPHPPSSHESILIINLILDILDIDVDEGESEGGIELSYSTFFSGEP